MNLATDYRSYDVPHQARFGSDWVDFVYVPAHIITKSEHCNKNNR